jgi:hypothetical protein
MRQLKTFEISAANGHLFGYYRAVSHEHAHKLISKESCTNEPIHTYKIIHHPEMDYLSDEEIDDLNLREVR